MMGRRDRQVTWGGSTFGNHLTGSLWWFLLLLLCPRPPPQMTTLLTRGMWVGVTYVLSWIL